MINAMNHNKRSILELREFSAVYGERVLIKPVSLDFPAGKLTALIGRNGTGKSTLLRAIAGLNENFTGELKIEGKGIKDMPAAERSHLLAFVNTQRPRIANLTCHDVVGMGRAPYTDWIGRLSDNDERIVEESLAKVGMADFEHRQLSTMSDGECQRVMIARALAQDTPVILLDEPTSFLDLPSRYELVSLLNHLSHDSGKTVIFSTHELDLAMRRADNIALLADKDLRLFPANSEATAKIVSEAFNLDFKELNDV